MDAVTTVEEGVELPFEDDAEQEESSEQGEAMEESLSPRPEMKREPKPKLEDVQPEAAPPIEAALRVKAPPAPAAQLAEEELWEEPPAQPEPRVKPPSSPAPPGELPQRRVVVIDENSEIDIQGSREVSPTSPGSNEMREGMADIGATLDDEKGHKRRWRMFRKGGE
jgi:hypothetical protein